MRLHEATKSKFFWRILRSRNLDGLKLTVWLLISTGMAATVVINP